MPFYLPTSSLIKHRKTLTVLADHTNAYFIKETRFYNRVRLCRFVVNRLKFTPLLSSFVTY